MINISTRTAMVEDVLKGYYFNLAWKTVRYRSEPMSDEDFAKLSIEDRESYRRGIQFAKLTECRFPPRGKAEVRVSPIAAEMFFNLYKAKAIT